MKKNLPTLKVQAQSIGIEAKMWHKAPQPSLEGLSIARPLAGCVKRLSIFLRDSADSIDLKITQGFDNLTGQKSNYDRATKLLLQKLAKTNYVDLTEVRLPVTPGLSVTWLELLEDLEVSTQFCVDMFDKYLEPYKKFLAEGLNDPEKFSNIATQSPVQIIDFEAMRKELGQNVNQPGSPSVRKYGLCVECNNDFGVAIERTNKISHAMTVANPELVMREVEEIKGMLAKLSESIQDTNLQYRFNGKAISSITAITYNVAEAIEFYAVLYTMILSHSTAMTDAVKKMERLL